MVIKLKNKQYKCEILFLSDIRSICFGDKATLDFSGFFTVGTGADIIGPVKRHNATSSLREAVFFMQVNTQNWCDLQRQMPNILKINKTAETEHYNLRYSIRKILRKAQ